MTGPQPGAGDRQPGAGDRQPEAGGPPPGAGPGAGGTPGLVRLTAWVEGRVQGVGFRWWVRSRALELGLSGTAENLPDGRVKIVAEGPEDRCQELLRRLQGGGTPGLVRRVTERWAAASGSLTGFVER